VSRVTESPGECDIGDALIAQAGITQVLSAGLQPAFPDPIGNCYPAPGKQAM